MAFVFTTQNSWDSQPLDVAKSIPAGFYPANIVEAKELYSKSGKPMLQLTMEVDAGGTHYITVKEYLLLEAASAWKIEQYLAAIGMQFGTKQEVQVDANTFLGGKLYLLTCNEPGLNNPDRLYMKAYKAFRAQDVKQPGALSEKLLEYYCLNPDGTVKGSKTEQRANAQPQPQPQNVWGNQQPQQQYPPQAMAHQQQYQQPANNWPQQPQPAYQPQQGQAPVYEEADDDIPF